MCHYITLIVPTDDTAAVKGLMETRGRTATPIDGVSVAKILRPNERQYLTAKNNCDCGTVLVQWPDSSDDEGKFIARLKRKKWSEGKIARAVAERREAAETPRTSRIDSYELWEKVILGLKTELNLPYVALFLRFYSGNIEDEAFVATRRELPAELSVLEGLSQLAENEVTIFRFNRRPWPFPQLQSMT